MIDTSRICAERRAAEAANDIDRLLAENTKLSDNALRFERAANDLRSSHLAALDMLSNSIDREDAMRAEIARLGDKLCAATQTISELNDRIVSANLLERARRTGVPE
jgi:uncharacterized protein with von Willebrand factor type A (vWA) domain